MTWFKVDDGLAFHPKAVAAGNAAMGMWVRAGAWSAQQLTDGFVPDHMIGALGKTAQAKALVTAGLWQREDGGYRFWQWQQRNPTRRDVEADREDAKERMRKAREGKRSGNVRADNGARSGEHTPNTVASDNPVDPVDNSKVSSESRSRNGNGDKKPALPRTATSGDSPSEPQVIGHPGTMCSPEQTPNSGEGSDNPVPSRPVVVVTNPSQSPNVTRESQPNDDDLTKIIEEIWTHRRRTVDLDWARRVAADIATRTPPDVRNRLAYTLTAIRNEPDRYLPTNTPDPWKPPPPNGKPPDDLAAAAQAARDAIRGRATA